ncbi:3D domain-containing protein [Mariprofundus ferrinatatus]|nr:3D domain-containing protein [Mariprofundus ferrinatatus]
MKHFRKLFLALLFVSLGSCSVAHSGSGSKHTLKVTASAYNSVKAQTHGNPAIGAWGDKLRPGMRVIAVSRDLIKMGLKHNTKVKIEGLPGYYMVKDKMHKRWKRKIDIYMGTDIKAARKWGKRKVKISW